MAVSVAQQLTPTALCFTLILSEFIYFMKWTMMQENKAILNERQVMLLSHLATQIIRNPENAIHHLQNAKASLHELGATDQDIDAINAYIHHLQETLKGDNRKYGWW